MAKIIQAIEVSYYHLLCDKCNMKVGKINTMDVSPSVLRSVVCADCYKEVLSEEKEIMKDLPYYRMELKDDGK